MDYSPLPMNENERRRDGRDCLASYVVAQLQGDPFDLPAIFDLDPPDHFLPIEGDDNERTTN